MQGLHKHDTSRTLYEMDLWLWRHLNAQIALKFFQTKLAGIPLFQYPVPDVRSQSMTTTSTLDQIIEVSKFYSIQKLYLFLFR